MKSPLKRSRRSITSIEWRWARVLKSVGSPVTGGEARKTNTSAVSSPTDLVNWLSATVLQTGHAGLGDDS